MLGLRCIRNGNAMVKRSIATALVAALLAMSMAGCASFQQTSQEAEAQAANRQYMSQVNQITDELTENLAAFDAAVSDNDPVAMRLQADNAFKTLDSLAALEPPEVLKDVQAGYVEGASKLEEALNSYIDLYTEIGGANAASTAVDSAAYSDQLAAIQQTYNDGIAKLQETDKQATEL